MHGSFSPKLRTGSNLAIFSIHTLLIPCFPPPRPPHISSDEDHTLGNALRHVLMQNKEVDFCGYSVPHPSEPKMNLRLQTTGKGDVASTYPHVSMFGVRSSRTLQRTRRK